MLVVVVVVAVVVVVGVVVGEAGRGRVGAGGLQLLGVHMVPLGGRGTRQSLKGGWHRRITNGSGVEGVSRWWESRAGPGDEGCG